MFVICKRTFSGMRKSVCSQFLRASTFTQRKFVYQKVFLVLLKSILLHALFLVVTLAEKDYSFGQANLFLMCLSFCGKIMPRDNTTRNLVHSK